LFNTGFLHWQVLTNTTHGSTKIFSQNFLKTNTKPNHYSKL